jgi:hypothetical protein
LSFVHCKQKNVATAKKAPPEAGDVWTWTAIDADIKRIPSRFVGGRDSDAAIIFMDDLASRLANRVQLTSDGHKAYLEAVEGAFGADGGRMEGRRGMESPLAGGETRRGALPRLGRRRQPLASTL